jgi:CBS domain-containing protein
MARFVREIMNPELFTVRRDARSADVLDAILEFGITAVPVVDDERRPIGVTSLRDIARDGSDPLISTPALSVPADASIDDAARILAESGRHHLVVVGGDGRAVGMVSSLDLLRAVLGLPGRYPSTFPHFDAATGVSWTDIAPLDVEHARAAPTGAGVLILSTGGVRRSERDLWVESPSALRVRLLELLENPPIDIPALTRILERSDLRFRCAAVADVTVRESVVRRMQARLEGRPPPELSSVPGHAG